MGHHHGPLKFIASPLRHVEHSEKEEQTPLGGSDQSFNKTNTNTEVLPFQNNDGKLHDTPEFQRHEEATTSELFYDLFFVANLTTFTSLLEINDHKSLSAYIGFFCVLWFTWYQVSLYDVRFSTDSIFERACKALHFGTMVGFAVMGPQWKPGEETNDYSTFKAFSLILMVSRLVLVVQYGSTLYFTRNYRSARLPLLLVMGSYTIAAILYGAFTAAFPKGNDYTTSNVYVAWYIISIAETLLTTAVSCRWRIISFKGTHLIERLSLLTLIILGEGIIVVCKAISKIVKNYYIFTASVVGQIIAAVLIIYFLYMLYFDRLRDTHFGTIKQQIWAFLHFPLHITLVLVLEGVSNFVVWRQAVQGLQAVLSDLTLDFSQTYNTSAEFVDQVNFTAWNDVFNYVPKGIDFTDALNEVNSALVEVANAWNNTSEEAVNAGDNALNNIIFALANTVLESLSIEAPKSKVKDGVKPSPEDQTSKLFGVFNLVFIYFFVTAGLTLIIMGVLAWLSEKPKKLGDYVRSSANFVVGLGLCLLSLMSFSEAEGNFAFSSWVLPTLCLSLFLVVVVNHVRFGKASGH